MAEHRRWFGVYKKPDAKSWIHTEREQQDEKKRNAPRDVVLQWLVSMRHYSVESSARFHWRRFRHAINFHCIAHWDCMRLAGWFVVFSFSLTFHTHPRCSHISGHESCHVCFRLHLMVRGDFDLALHHRHTTNRKKTCIHKMWNEWGKNAHGLFAMACALCISSCISHRNVLNSTFALLFSPKLQIFLWCCCCTTFELYTPSTWCANVECFIYWCSGSFTTTFFSPLILCSALLLLLALELVAEKKIRGTHSIEFPHMHLPVETPHFSSATKTQSNNRVNWGKCLLAFFSTRLLSTFLPQRFRYST